jgi:hypothetical protein
MDKQSILRPVSSMWKRLTLATLSGRGRLRRSIQQDGAWLIPCPVGGSHLCVVAALQRLGAAKRYIGDF